MCIYGCRAGNHKLYYIPMSQIAHDKKPSKNMQRRSNSIQLKLMWCTQISQPSEFREWDGRHWTWVQWDISSVCSWRLYSHYKMEIHEMASHNEKIPYHEKWRKNTAFRRANTFLYYPRYSDRRLVAITINEWIRINYAQVPRAIVSTAIRTGQCSAPCVSHCLFSFLVCRFFLFQI